MSIKVEGEEEVSELLEIVMENIGEIVPLVSAEIFDDLTDPPNGDSTPRDTLRATNAWTIDPGSTPSDGDPGLLTSGKYPEPMSGRVAAKGTFASTPRPVREAVVANRTPYIGDLDQGTSRQAPKGFVDRAIDKALDSIVRFRLFERRRF